MGISFWCGKSEAFCVGPFVLHRQQPKEDEQNIDFAPTPGKISADAHDRDYGFATRCV